MKLFRLPLLPLALALLAGAMLFPALFALALSDWSSARGFLYSAIFTGFAATALGVTLVTRQRRDDARTELLELLVCWLLVPAFAAIPIWLRTPYISPLGAWFEMTADFTTTGGTVYGAPDEVPPAVHLWRGMMGWLGGLFTLTAAFAIMAPRNLGGFEVIVRRTGPAGMPAVVGEGTAPGLHERLPRALRAVLPVYAVLTAVLVFLLSVLGHDGLPATVHAMSIVSTSGISPYALGLGEHPNFGVELVATVFMVFVAMRLTYTATSIADLMHRLPRDPELRLMGVLVATATAALFVRHWIGVQTISDLGAQVSEALPAFWGGLCTSISFLTTTGFESASWHTARDWSGLDNPGLILLGLCAIGGGAATTAGGIKLVRCYALLHHGYRELERIAQPNSAIGSGTRLSGILREGAFLAWAFIMLHSIVVFVAMIALTITGLAFEHSLIAALAAISNTGPALSLVTPEHLDFSRLGESQRIILALTMIVGRVEVLAVISIFNPDSWSRLSSRTKNTGNAAHKTAESGRRGRRARLTQHTTRTGEKNGRR